MSASIKRVALARRIVATVLDELNDRSGCGLGDVDIVTEDEIKRTLTRKVRAALVNDDAKRFGE